MDFDVSGFTSYLGGHGNTSQSVLHSTQENCIKNSVSLYAFVLVRIVMNVYIILFPADNCHSAGHRSRLKWGRNGQASGCPTTHTDKVSLGSSEGHQGIPMFPFHTGSLGTRMNLTILGPAYVSQAEQSTGVAGAALDWQHRTEANTTRRHFPRLLEEYTH